MKFVQAKEALLRKLAYKVLIQVVEAAAHDVDDVGIEKLKLQTLMNQMFVSLSQSSFENASSGILLFIIEKIEYFLINLSLIVKKHFFILIGRIAKYFPCLIKEKASRILKFVIHQLEKEV